MIGDQKGGVAFYGHRNNRETVGVAGVGKVRSRLHSPKGRENIITTGLSQKLNENGSTNA